MTHLVVDRFSSEHKLCLVVLDCFYWWNMARCPGPEGFQSWGQMRQVCDSVSMAQLQILAIHKLLAHIHMWECKPPEQISRFPP